MKSESAYWIALAHLPRWGYLNINNLIISFHHKNRITIEDFFSLPDSKWKDEYNLSNREIEDLTAAKAELPNYSFIAESLFNDGYDIIPLISEDYPQTLKENLKAAHSPALLYIKGNKNLFKEKSIAIVGSREASKKALEFTDNIAKLASKDYKVVVSGFAKGVDKQALDSALKYKGQSIIVLPQGIMTFTSGMKLYYEQIVNGDVVVLSTFFPKAPWKAELAMARNPIIYGLANEIFVAESSEKGGTWSGVIDGLRKGRNIFVRKPEPSESNANELLIQKGAIPVDFVGTPLSNTQNTEVNTNKSDDTGFQKDFQTAIIELLKSGEFSIKDIIKQLSLQITTKEIKSFLTSNNEILITKKKPLMYSHKSYLPLQNSLFD